MKMILAGIAGLAAAVLAVSPAMASPAPLPTAPASPPPRVAPAPSPAPSGSAAAAPASTYTCDVVSNVSVISQYNQNYAWKLTGSDDHLEMYNASNGGQSFFCPIQVGPDPVWGYANLLAEVGGSHPGYCLGWNYSKTQFDVRTTAPCNTSFTTGTWDLWQGSSGSPFQQMFTIWNEQTPTQYQTAWSNGLNVPVIAYFGSGTNPSDHFQFVPRVQG